MSKAGNTWTHWTADGDIPARVRCNECDREVSEAIVFPGHGLRLCLNCLKRTIEAIKEENEKESSRPSSRA